MAAFTWTYDAPSNTYKNHALSSQLFEASVAKSVFIDHTSPVNGYGRKMGESVTLTRVRAITEPASAVLTEGERIPEDEFQLSTTTISPSEIGRAVPYTSLSIDFSKFDLENNIQRELRRQLTLTLDTMAAAAYKQAQIKYIPTGAVSRTLDTDGTPSTQATSNLNVWHLASIRDDMFGTYFVPMLGDHYVGICNFNALRGIKNDDDFEEWKKYTDPSAKFNSEVGQIEQIRMIETNHDNALTTKGLNSVLGESVFFGEDNVAMAEVMMPELRASLPEDGGRDKSILWYGILDFGIIWDTSNAGESRIFHVTSS